MYSDLERCLDEHSLWKKEHLGKDYHRMIGDITDVSIEDNLLRVETFGFDRIDERYGEFYYRYPLPELLSERWREMALNAYEEQQLKLLEEQRIKDEALKQEVEEKERAELARLKAKYETL